MKKKLLYISALLLTGIITSCKKDQYYLFNDTARLQFGPTPDRIYTASYDLADTLKRYTFYFEPTTTMKDTVYFDLYAIGGVRDADRPFALEQVEIPGVMNAVPGQHYVAFDDKAVKDLYVIKAGEVRTKVPVILLRDPSMKLNNYQLKIVVKPNDNFQNGESTKLWRRVEFSDRLNRPPSWDDYYERYYWGKYSNTKHLFMIDSTGKKWDEEFMSEIKQDMSTNSFWRNEVRKYLTKYNLAHPSTPLKDEFGDLVIFP